MRTKFLGSAAIALSVVAGCFLWFSYRLADDSTSSSKQQAVDESIPRTASAAFLPILGPASAATITDSRLAQPLVRTPGDRIRELNKSPLPRDRYESFQLVKRCLAAKSLEANIKNTVQSERRASYPELDEFKGACDGIFDQELGSRRENLKIALAAHIPGSAHEFYMDGFNGDWSAVTQRPDDPLVKEWLHQSVAALQESAKQGDTEAMLDLNQLYKSGGPVERDPGQALTYLVARATVMAQRGHPIPESFISNQEKGLTADQVAAAMAAAKAITDQCCKGGS